MNREIKFRAWFKSGNEMFQIDVLALTECDWSAEGNRGVSIPYQPSIEVMQFTGIKDKKGKEIYEGDIFNCIYLFDGCNKHKLKIEYNESNACFRPVNIGGRCDQKQVVISMSDMTRNEIIGNIHENPELLEKIKE